MPNVMQLFLFSAFFLPFLCQIELQVFSRVCSVFIQDYPALSRIFPVPYNPPLNTCSYTRKCWK